MDKLKVWIQHSYILFTGVFGYIIVLISSCEKGMFHEVPGFTCDQGVTHEWPGVSLKTCTRNCRHLAECYAFNMLWDGVTGSGTGTCQIVQWERHQHAESLQMKSDASYFGSCPQNMVWNPNNTHCYLLVQEKKGRDGAEARCPGLLHPLAHLVDITSAQEDAFVLELVMPHAANRPFHTAGRRADVSSNFFWQTTNAEVVYGNWVTEGPTIYPRSDQVDRDCIFISNIGDPPNEWGWGNWNCIAEKYFICEF